MELRGLPIIGQSRSSRSSIGFPWLEDHLPPGIHGFVPGHETGQIWHSVQGLIELALQQDEEVVGLSADLQKAFNNIGRAQTFALARHVGLPQCVIVPWNAFVTGVERRFDIRGCLSRPLNSTHGFPEGDPMSILAMVLANYAHHQYEAAYSVSVTTFTFVDNLSLIARHPQELFHGFITMKTFYELWGLAVDDEKAFTWAVTSEHRQLLRSLGFPTAHTQLELGGMMNYTRRCRTSALMERGQGLEVKWQRLQRSAAPIEQKLQVIPNVFWAAQLHGTMAHQLSESFLHTERKKVSKALNWRAPGTNIRLKLLLSDVPMADLNIIIFGILLSCSFGC